MAVGMVIHSVASVRKPMAKSNQTLWPKWVKWMQWMEPFIADKEHVGDRVKILTGPFIGEVGVITGTIRWGASRNAMVEIGTLEARYGCGPGVPLQVHERSFKELEKL